MGEPRLRSFSVQCFGECSSCAAEASGLVAVYVPPLVAGTISARKVHILFPRVVGTVSARKVHRVLLVCLFDFVHRPAIAHDTQLCFVHAFNSPLNNQPQNGAASTESYIIGCQSTSTHSSKPTNAC